MIIAISGEFGDNLEQFVYYKVERNEVRERESVFTPPGGVEALLKQFVGLEVDLLIAGKLPSGLEEALFEAGISVISGVNGKSDAVLKEYLAGTLDF